MNTSRLPSIQLLPVVVVLTIIAAMSGAGAGFWYLKRTHPIRPGQPTATKAPNQPASVANGVPKDELAVQSAHLPQGWALAVQTAHTISLVDTERQCSVRVDKIFDSTATTAHADAFVQKLQAIAQGVTTDGSVTKPAGTNELHITTTARIQTLTGYDSLTSDAAGHPIMRTTTAYIVRDGYYTEISESCPNSADPAQADQALRAVTIPEE